MRKKIGIIFGVSSFILLLSVSCQRPTDFTFDNLHCTQARMETDIDAQVSGETLTVKVCVQCGGTPAEGAAVEGHVLKTESFDPPEAIGHVTFPSPDDNACTTKDISLSGSSSDELIGQMFEATVKDIKGTVADQMTGQIRLADDK